eukprot:Lankesteria_metandrocarpae@DN3470_c1_g1_i2.p1
MKPMKAVYMMRFVAHAVSVLALGIMCTQLSTRVLLGLSSLIFEAARSANEWISREPHSAEEAIKQQNSWARWEAAQPHDNFDPTGGENTAGTRNNSLEERNLGLGGVAPVPTTIDDTNAEPQRMTVANSQPTTFYTTGSIGTAGKYTYTDDSDEVPYSRTTKHSVFLPSSNGSGTGNSMSTSNSMSAGNSKSTGSMSTGSM